MRLECPACHYSANVDPAKIPLNGGKARCPKCSGLFAVPPPSAPDSPKPSPVTCPKCGFDQDGRESCQRCGLIFAKYQEAQQRLLIPDEVASAAASVGSSEMRPVPFGSGRGYISSWLEDGRIDEDKAGEAFALAGVIPDRSKWRGFLDGLALWVGAIFLAAAAIFFFAYNWRLLGRFTRFGLIELMLIAAVLVAWRVGLDRMAGKAAVLVATLLVGALLALEGQTYQTGADPWELFATWAIFVLPWVAVSRFAPLWLVLVALVNLSVSLYYHVFAGLFGLFFGSQTLWWILAVLNAAALAVWEVAAARGISWLNERWPQRLLATASAGYVTVLAAWAIVGTSRADTSGLHVIGYLVWLTCAYAVYRHRIRDLYVLALGVLSAIVVVTVFLGKNLVGQDHGGAFLLIGVLVLGMSAAGGWWLRNVAREVEA